MAKPICPECGAEDSLVEDPYLAPYVICVECGAEVRDPQGGLPKGGGR